MKRKADTIILTSRARELRPRLMVVSPAVCQMTDMRHIIKRMMDLERHIRVK